jgi:hypothetical protein
VLLDSYAIRVINRVDRINEKEQETHEGKSSGSESSAPKSELTPPLLLGVTGFGFLAGDELGYARGLEDKNKGVFLGVTAMPNARRATALPMGVLGAAAARRRGVDGDWAPAWKRGSAGGALMRDCSCCWSLSATSMSTSMSTSTSSEG